MPATYPQLTTSLAEAGTDGYLIHADGEDSDQHYLSGFYEMGDFLTLYADGEVRLLVPDLEYRRARTESDADSVDRFSEFDYGRLYDEHGPVKAGALVAAAFLAEYGIDGVSVPPSFPNGTADALREDGVEVRTDYDETVTEIRAVKTDDEIDRIAETQRATEEAIAIAEGMLERATVEAGVLHVDGEVLTSEHLREAIEITLFEEGCRLGECIAASGPESAKPHAVGSGPIEVGEPIVVDVAPRDSTSGYVADMTRTFLKGDPDPVIEEWYDVTREAYETALELIEPGVTGETVNDAVCEVFERAGYPTLRTDEATDTGLTHPTGHGVGLDLHERPRLSWGGAELEPGHVVTVEPGLYDPDVGGVRLEDLLVVTEDGYEILTDYSRDLLVV